MIFIICAFSPASVVRQRVVNFMRQTFDKVEDAEACYGLDIDYYLLDAPTCATQSGPSLRLDEVLVSLHKVPHPATAPRTGLQSTDINF